MMQSMKKWLATLSFLCLPLLANALTFKDKLLGAKVGDFVVTEQNKIYSVLLVKAIFETSIELEEISVPMHSFDSKKMGWRAWLDQNAPGSSSWMVYHLDFVEEKLQESYSLTQNKWLYTDETDYLLAKLLTLSLTPVPEKERRRIGPSPEEGVEDRRALWNPPLVRESAKVKKPCYEVYRGKWPKDSSELSECTILLYFDKENPSFPFPYWLELSNGYISIKLRTVDSGTKLQTPLTRVELPPYFHFAGPLKEIQEGLRLTLSTLSNDSQFQVVARDLTDPASPSQPMECTQRKAPQKGTFYLDIPKKLLASRLKPGHSYQWLVRSKTHPEMTIEMRSPYPP